MSIDVKHVGERLKAAREAKRLKQKDVAAKINETEPMSAPLLSKYENGGALVPLEKLVALADLYEVSLDELIGRDVCATNQAAPKELTLADAARIICQLLDYADAIYKTPSYPQDSFVGAITIKNKALNKFFVDRSRLVELVHSKTIEHDMFNDWQERQFQKLELSHIDPIIDLLEVSDDVQPREQNDGATTDIGGGTHGQHHQEGQILPL